MAQADAVGPTQGRIGAGITFELQQLDGDVGSRVVQGDKAPGGLGRKSVAIDAARCTGCGACLPACPRQALAMPTPLWTLP